MGNLTTTYDSAKNIIKNDLASMSKKFITIGYYLKYIRDNEMYTQDGFTSIWEFAQETYGISKSTCSRWMAMNDKFSENGNSPYLKEEFADFGKSQLQEMLYLDNTQIEKATPEMTAKEIRQLKEPESIPGQMEIQDYPEFLPEGQQEEAVTYFTLGGEAYGWTWNKVVEAYLTKGYKNPESGMEVKSLGKMYLVLRRKERTFFYDSQGNTLFEVENKRLEKEYEYMQEEDAAKTAAEPERITQEEHVATAKQDVEGEEQQAAGQEEQRKESVALAQQTTEEEIEYNAIAIKDCLFEQEKELAEYEACEGLPVKMMLRKRMVVDALKLLLTSQEDEKVETEETPQIPLPELKNNDQRKEWLNNYRSWGVWYKDEHTGATYYRYRFDNGADLIAEEYECESEYIGTHTSSYLHLVGGPEPPRKSGIPKWSKYEKYNRYPNNETELVEFLKALQKGKQP